MPDITDDVMIRKSSIILRSGKTLDYRNPDPASIDLADIVISLCRHPRYTGQTFADFSVAQHILLVEFIAKSYCEFSDILLAKDTLLQIRIHDATEAYMCDLSKPLKNLLPEYERIEYMLWKAIARHFQVTHIMDPIVKHADNLALIVEAHLNTPLSVDYYWMDQKFKGLHGSVEQMIGDWVKLECIRTYDNCPVLKSYEDEFNRISALNYRASSFYFTFRDI